MAFARSSPARHQLRFRRWQAGLPIGQKQINPLCLPREILFRIGSLLLTWLKYTCKVFTPIAVCHISLGCALCLCLPRRWEPSYWGGETIIKIPSGGTRLHSIAWTTPLSSGMVYGINHKASAESRYRSIVWYACKGKNGFLVRHS